MAAPLDAVPPSTVATPLGPVPAGPGLFTVATPLGAGPVVVVVLVVVGGEADGVVVVAGERPGLVVSLPGDAGALVAGRSVLVCAARAPVGRRPGAFLAATVPGVMSVPATVVVGTVVVGEVVVGTVVVGGLVLAGRVVTVELATCFAGRLVPPRDGCDGRCRADRRWLPVAVEAPGACAGVPTVRRTRTATTAVPQRMPTTGEAGRWRGRDALTRSTRCSGPRTSRGRRFSS